MEHLKKINMRILIMLLLATQIQAQVVSQYFCCDSITYWTDQSQGFNIGLDTSNIVHNPDSIDVWWSVCTNGLCYAGQGMYDYFPQIMTTDTLQVCYDVYLYTSNVLEICTHCDSLIFDQNTFSWIVFNIINPVSIFEIKSKIINNKMYDLYGREILKPKGLYIKNNKLYYVR